MCTAYVYGELREGAYLFAIPGLPDRFAGDVGFVWAFTLSVLTAAEMGLLVYVLVFTPLTSASSLAKVVASVGVVVALTSLVERRFSDTTNI